MSDRPAARASYDEAWAIVKTLRPADGMTEPVYLVEGRILQSIGWWHHARGSRGRVGDLAAQSPARSSRKVSRPGRAGPSPPQDKEALLSLADHAPRRSAARWDALGRIAESLSDQERSLGIVRELAAADPNDPQVRISHAVTYFNIGGLLRSQDRWSDAFSAYRAGADIVGETRR